VQAELSTITGTLSRIRAQREDWAVLELEPDHGDPITVVGTVGELTPGSVYEVTGSWRHSGRWGSQLRAETVKELLPQTLAGIQAYLCSGALPEIGPARAAAIVARWGERALEVLDETPEALAQIRGITPARAQEITKAWQEKRAEAKASCKLHSYGLTSYQIGRLKSAYSTLARALEVLHSDPYRIIVDVEGIGWIRADAVASRMGLTSEDPRRARAGVVHLLRESSQREGHTYLPRTELLKRARKDLEIPEPVAVDAIEDALGQGWLVEEDDCLGLRVLREAEGEILERLMAMAMAEGRELTEAEARAVEAVVQSHSLTEEQAEAVREACRRQVLVVTGGPGTGKTHTMRAVIAAWEQALGIVVRARRPWEAVAIDPIALAAPTGKAAQRLAELTGRKASTIHRLLHWEPEQHLDVNLTTRFAHGLDCPLPQRGVVIDETSMVDVPLMRCLVRALGRGQRLLLVGDADQLPSVGPGAVLRDLVDGGLVPVVRLTQIHRQEAGSLITQGAHAVIHGRRPEFSDNGGDLKGWWSRDEEDRTPSEVAREIAARIVRLVAGEDGLRVRGYEPDQVQVLTPGHRGPCGDDALNRALQDALNPPGPPEVKVGGGKKADKGEAFRVIRLGDRVIQTRNNYDLEVFNGEIGRVVEVREGVAVVDYGDRRLTYQGEDLWDLRLAYALTVHKSQGSEFPCVVLACHTTHAILLKRQLLYTALTRARSLCVVVGTWRALGIAVKEAGEERRWTWTGRRFAA